MKMRSAPSRRHDAAGHLRQRLAHLHFLEVEHLGAECTCQRETAGVMVDGDHAMRA